MNIIDAIKSGHHFRRKGDTAWKWKAPEGDFLRCNSGIIACLKPDEIIADDWEIEEATVTITRSQFWNAVQESINECRSYEAHFAGHHLQKNEFSELAERLGLGRKP